MLCWCGVDDLLRLIRRFPKVLLCVLPVVLGMTAGPAFAGLKPDPPPKPAPPPPPVSIPAPPPPAQPQPQPPPPPPVSQGTSVDANAAARLAAANRARRARARAARLKVKRAQAAKKAQAIARARARRRAQSARTVPAAARVALNRTRHPLAAQLQPESKVARVLPFALVLMGLAFLLFSLAAVPARVMPWWAERALDNRRENLAFMGVAALLAIGALFLAG